MRKQPVSKLQKLKEAVHKKYRSFGSVKCAAINEQVLFNRYGWVHLSFDGKGHKRNTDNIIMRLHLVLYAPEVIQNAPIVIKDELVKLYINGVERQIRFIELACSIISTKKYVTVILRKIADGNLHFYSVRRTKNRVKKLLLKQKSP